MSGKQSRQRRLEAVRRAREDVYRHKGGNMPKPPFDNERQNRIYATAYAAIRDIYWRCEMQANELRVACGGL